MTRPDLKEAQEGNDRLDNNSTSWNETKVANKDVTESSSTTYARNSRFGLLENGDWVTPDRFDELATPVGPLYEFTVPAGDTYIVTGKERNAYAPGADYTSAFATQYSDNGPEGNILPEGITATQGLGDFRDGQEEGVALVFEPDDAKFGTFQNNTLSNVKTKDEWGFDPFASSDFAYDTTRFAVKREEGNFYGSGSQRLYMKLRNVETGKESYKKITEVGDPSNPIVDVFNLFNQVKVENTSGSPFTFSIGPLQYANEGSNAPGRGKTSAKRDLNVDAGFTDTAGTVIAVYRKDPDNIEVPVSARVAGKAGTNGEVELREVHPDYLTFGATDPDVDGNWGPPAGLRQRETGLQEFDAPTEVTIQTDSSRMRGEQASYAAYDFTSGGGPIEGTSQPAKAEDSENINEFNYFAAVVKHEDTSENVDRYQLLTNEGW